MYTQEEKALDLESKERKGLIVSKNQSISIPAHRSIDVQAEQPKKFVSYGIQTDE